MKKATCWFVALGLVAALAGCGGRPMKFPVPESELGDRPGLFTGDEGAWKFYPALPSQPR